MKLLLGLSVFLLSSIGTTLQAREIDNVDETIVIHWNMNLAKNNYIEEDKINSTESNVAQDKDINSTENTIPKQDINSTESIIPKNQDINSTESTIPKNQDINSTESTIPKNQDINSNKDIDNETIIIHWTMDSINSPIDYSENIKIFDDQVMIDGQSYSQNEFMEMLQQAELNPITPAETMPSDSNIKSRGLGVVAVSVTKFALNMIGGFVVEKIAEEIIIYAGDKIIDSSSWLYKTIKSWYYEVLY